MTLKKTLPIIFFNIIAVQQAHAYLDPGTGSMLLQILLGGLVATIMTFKVYWRKVKSFTARLFFKSENNESEVSE